MFLRSPSNRFQSGDKSPHSKKDGSLELVFQQPARHSLSHVRPSARTRASAAVELASNQSREEDSCYLGPRLLSYSDRSEEHTSEPQSRLHLVCRLLLEKKNNPEQID